MILKNLISILLYVSFVFNFMVGAYTLAINKKTRLNHVFALLCLSLAWWGFTFAASNSARSYEEVLLFRKISVLGWGVALVLFCILLLF